MSPPGMPSPVQIPEAAFVFGRLKGDRFVGAWFPDLDQKWDDAPEPGESREGLGVGAMPKVLVVFSTSEEATKFHQAFAFLLQLLTPAGPGLWHQDYPVTRLTRGEILGLLRTALLSGVGTLLFDPGLPTSARADILRVLAENDD